MPFGSRRCERLLLGALACLLGLALPALADPPARVGRLSAIAGTVSFHDSGDEQWSPAALNYPVTSGNSFWTEPGARARIEIGSTAIHLDSSTELDITALDDRRLDATLPQGTINIRVPRFSNGDGYAIATPRGTVTLAAPGTYRIFAGTDRDPTQVAVLEGAARVVDRNSTVSLSRGEEALLSGTDTIDYQITEAQPTPFDNDSLASERREEQAALPAARYVSPEMTGYEDLDEHGSWGTDPTYGPVWYPQAVPVDWAPYRYGHWRWIAPWGWTWIDDQPWGFAPFHYGRWAHIGNRWGWTPGTIVARPVYAPALVAFVGGGGWGVSVSGGGGPSVGWFPLAPREVYVPSYPASVTYVRKVNVTNVVNVTNITNRTINNVNITNIRHANRQFATVVPQDAFIRSQPAGRAAIAVPRDALARAPVATGVPLAPTVAAASGHQEAVRRATLVARAQGQRIDGPAPQAMPHAAGASPAAPGPTIAHAGRQEDRHAQRSPGQPQQPSQPQQATEVQQPGQRPQAARPEPNAPVWSKSRPAATTAAPGPPIAPHEQAQAGTAPASTQPQANGAPSRSQAKPPAAVAPGPPIEHAGRSGTEPPRPVAHDAAQPGQPTAAAREPARHGAAQPRQTAQKGITASTPPERAMTRPVQQTVLQPTHQGWVRAPSPQVQHPQHNAPHAAPPQKATAPTPKKAPAPAPAPHGNGGHPSSQPDQKRVNG